MYYHRAWDLGTDVLEMWPAYPGHLAVCDLKQVTYPFMGLNSLICFGVFRVNKISVKDTTWFLKPNSGVILDSSVSSLSPSSSSKHGLLVLC